MPSFKKKLLLTVSVAVAINLILGVILLYLARTLNKQAGAIAQTRKEINDREAALISLETLRRDSEKAKLYITELREILPTKSDLEQFPKDITKLARTNEVAARFSFGDDIAAKDSEPTAATFRVTASGTYNALTNFLKVLENSQYFIAFEKIDIARESETKKYSALISARVYYR